MRIFSMEKEAGSAVPARRLEATDAWPESWPQNARDFEVLVDAYLDPLVRFAARRLGSVHDAEDVVQEVFVRAFVMRKKCQDVAQVGAYLYRMTSNACTDLVRKRKCRKSPAPAVQTGGDRNPVMQTSPSESLQAAEGAFRAEMLLRRLPRLQAEAIRFRVFGELSLNEMATVMKCSVNTVNSRLRYGFMKLRRILAKESTS